MLSKAREPRRTVPLGSLSGRARPALTLGSSACERPSGHSASRFCSLRLVDRFFFVFIFVLIVLAPTLSAYAAPGVPRMLNYQGRLLSSGGTLLGGSGTEYCFKFSFYDVPTVGSGTKLWPSGAPSTMIASVRSGVFTVAIGDTNSGGDVLDFNFQDTDAAYLNVEVATKVGATCAPGDGAESFETFSPRQRILASGYAINAGMVGGYAAAQYASGNQIPVLASGHLILGGTNPFINATTTNALTLQGGGEATGDIRFFSAANRITAQGDLTLAGGVVASAATTTNATSTTLFSALGRFTSAIIDSLVAVVATITNLTATNIVVTNATTTNATTTNLFASALSALSGLFGNISATTSASLASTTAQGRLITGNIVATSTATSSFAGPVRVGLDTSSYRFSILGSTTAATSATGTAILAVSNSNPTLSSGTNILRLNHRTNFGTVCTSASTCPRFIEYFVGVPDNVDTGGRGVGSLRLSTAGTGITQTSGAADFAEYMVLNSAASVGDLVSLNSNGEYQRAVAGQSLIGVISDNPAFVGNANLEGEPNAYVVGFAGVIETTVSTANGVIGAGDFIAASTTAGVGVKLVGSGFTLGQALEAWSGPGTGQISVLVFPKYIDAAVALNEYGGSQGGASGYWSLATSTGAVTLASSTYALSLSNKLDLQNASATQISASYASSTQGFFGSLSIGNLSGILRATAGSITASLVNLATDVTGFLGVSNGGTGTSTAPTLGQLLVGNAVGGYDLIATSSLGITGTFSTSSGSFFSSQGLAFSTTSNDYWKSVNNFFSTTSADYYISQANLSGFSTTSADYWQTQRNFFSTSSASYFSSLGLAFSTTSSNYWKSVNDFFSTTSAAHFTSVGLAFSTTSNDYWKSVNNFFSTTSADHYTSLGLAFSTTSSDYWGSTKGYATFGYLFPDNATTTLLSLNGGVIANASSSITNLSTINSTSTNATTTRLAITGLTSSLLSTNAQGGVIATTTLSTNYLAGALGTINGTTFNAGSSIIVSAASSTLLADSNTFSGSNTFNGQTTLTNATSTSFAITNTPNALLATRADGSVYATTSLSSLYLDTTGNWSGTFDGQEGSYYLANSFSTTSATNFSNLGLAFSTTSNDYWKSVNNFFSTTSADYWETQQTTRTADDLTDNSIEDLNDVAVMTENYGDLFAWNGSTWTDFATSSLGIALGDTTGTLAANRGGTGLSTITAAGILLGNYAGTGWQQLSTSTLGILSTHVAEGTNLYYQDSRVQSFLNTIDKGYFFSTTSAAHFLAQNQGASFSTTSADYYTSSSTTIPKTYTANAFTALQTFENASSTNLTVSNLASTSNLVASNSFTFGSASGILKAVAGVVTSTFVNLATDVSGFLGISNGGTGTSTAPTYGQVLVGNAIGGYDLVATSSLGIAAGGFSFGYLFPGNATSTVLSFESGLLATASSTIGNGTQAGGLTISGGATTTGNLVVQGSGTSTFAHGVDIASGCFAVNGTCVGAGGGGGGSGVLIAIQAFTSNSTYTPSPGVTNVQVIVTGGGGGGGGAAGAAADTTTEHAGGGGGAGGTSIAVLDASALAGTTVTVGAGGTAGSNAGGNGGAGSPSSFGSFATGNGGALGTGTGQNGNACTTAADSAPGGAGGTAATGDVNITGGAGQNGTCLAEFVQGGDGGSSYWGGGGAGGKDDSTTNAGAAGSAGNAYGAGGGGGAEEDSQNATAAAGGAGAGGVVIVYEYGPFVGVLAVDDGGTGTTTAPAYGQLLIGDGLGGYDLVATSSLGISGGGASFSTTSADYWKTERNFFSTTSASHFSSLGLAFSTTSTQYYVSTTDLFSTTSANYFTHSSTTLAKTYTANTFTALQTFGNASTTNISASYASSTQGFFGALSIGNLSGILRATAGAISSTLVDLASDVSGVLQVASGGTGWGNIESGTLLTGNGTGAVATTTVGSSLQLSGGTLALNTGNANIWTALQHFSFASSTQFSAGRASFGQTATTTIDTAGNVAVAGALNVTGNTTLSAATTTNLLVTASSTFQDFTSRNATSSLLYTNAFRGAGLAGCDTSGDKLLWNSLTGQFSCGVDAGGSGSGISSLGAPGQLQTGATQTFATSSDTNLGITITSAGDTHTFAMNWLGTLAVSRGGTGWGNIESGTLLTGNGTGALATTTVGSSLQLAGATLGLNLANTNIWSGLQRFGSGASTTALSANDFVAVGRTATTTIRGEANATSTFAGAVSFTSASTTATSTLAGVQISTIKNCAEALETDANGNVICGNDAGVDGVTVTTFAADGTWTKSNYPNLTFSQVILTAGGGGGGGADCSDTACEVAAGGGGAGGTAIEMIAAGSLGSTETVTVGTGGTAGANTGTDGGAGNPSSFGSHNSATGGGAGDGLVNGAAGIAGNEVAGGVGSGGDINLTGGTGDAGAPGAEGTKGGAGGASYWGGGGGGGWSGANAIADAGSNGVAYGSGGGGASVSDTTTGAAGGAGAAGVVVTMNYTSSGADLAEWYETSEDVEVGDVVAISTDSYEYDSKLGLQKSSVLAKATARSSVVGVVSTAPSETIGYDIFGKAEHPQPIALAGRVPVKASFENGDIKAGDLLTVSSMPGVAMRATKAGVTIGKALEDAVCSAAEATASSTDTSTLPICTVLIIVNTSYTTGALLNVAFRDLGMDTDTISTELDYSKMIFAEMMQQKKNITASTTLSEILTDRLAAGLEVITPRVVTDTVVANVIQPLENDVRIQLDDGEFVIERRAQDSTTLSFDTTSTTSATSSLALSIDALGNAVFAGAITGADFIIGTREKPGGITMYDTDTGDPYCARIVYGKLETFAGTCADVASLFEAEPEEESTYVPNASTPESVAAPENDDVSGTPDVEVASGLVEMETIPETESDTVTTGEPVPPPFEAGAETEDASIVLPQPESPAPAAEPTPDTAVSE